MNKAVFLSLANPVLKNLDFFLKEAVCWVAESCTVDGRLDQQRLDGYQATSYEIAWIAADLLASQVLVRAYPAQSPLDQALSMTFIGQTLISVHARLEHVLLELGLDTAAIASLKASDSFQNALRMSTTSSHNAATGCALAQARHEIGQPQLSAEVAMARDAFERFAQQEVLPMAEAIHRQDLDVPADIIAGMQAMGAFGLSIPESYGGSAPASGDNLPLMLAVTETLSAASLAAAGSLLTRPEILSRALLTGGTEQQKQHWLPRIASGELLCAIAITEPDAGSDVARLTLRANKVKDGWRLDGTKTWCTFAGQADVLMVVARTSSQPGHRGLSLFLVSKPRHPGHSFTHQQDQGGRLDGHAIPTIGYRGMHSFDVHFDNFFVPDANLIGESQGLGQGFYLTMAGMTGGRMQTAARACGVMQAAIAAAVSHAKDRKIFGAALIDLQLTQVRIAKMAAQYQACRLLAYAVAQRLDSGEGLAMEASLAKLLACRSAELVTRDALQLHGGMGYAEEMPVSRYFVDARVLSIFEGSEEALALRVISRSLYEAALAR
ncbi:acyl-CoA dehydrogenase family protein [Bordetella genomosp. 12]|uniref:3-sulfinopropanoyl-CoA desulfinase n=1 Tax=Bordetella genomosp. 12 TaxID=463035 RepID=A0A261VBE8_9BORD|nr:acyl-CoA dehydrogenase family protein [Bordetella genomosp. 12]OZI70882.1 acyl-CoA dehydrogenase [Bordetella genomosp. 12]